MGVLRHVVSRKCLSVSEANDKFTMEECDKDKTRLFWEVQNYNQTLVNSEDQ